MPKMAQAVSRYNAQLLKSDQQLPRHPPCYCRAGEDRYPVQGKCQQAGVVYKALVTDNSSGHVDTYIGMTGRSFKARWKEHKHDIKSVSGREKTKQSIHVWEIKDNGALVTSSDGKITLNNKYKFFKNNNLN